MVVSLNRVTPISTPRYYGPCYGIPTKGVLRYLGLLGMGPGDLMRGLHEASDLRLSARHGECKEFAQ